MASNSQPEIIKLSTFWRRLHFRVARWYMYFQTRNPNLGTFGRVLQRRMLVCIFMAIWNIFVDIFIFGVHLVYFGSICYILWPFGTFYGHLVYYDVIWYIMWYLVYIFPFWYVAPRIIWQSCCTLEILNQAGSFFF
jgi:hypothetical protein